MATTKHGMRIVLESIKKNVIIYCDRMLSALDDSDTTPQSKQAYTMMCGGLSNRLAYYSRIIVRWKRRNTDK